MSWQYSCRVRAGVARETSRDGLPLSMALGEFPIDRDSRARDHGCKCDGDLRLDSNRAPTSQPYEADCSRTFGDGSRRRWRAAPV